MTDDGAVFLATIVVYVPDVSRSYSQSGRHDNGNYDNPSCSVSSV